MELPLAIPAGMTAAALATGNAVVLKPAEQSPGCALRAGARRCARRASRRAALALLPGEGEVGAALVRHPGVHTIAFTGSAAVGLEIVRRRRDPAGQRHVKRVIAEMGGKNCVIVDADADLDEAVPAIVARRSPTPARSARPRRGCWCTRPSPTRWSSGSPGPSTCWWSVQARKLRAPTCRR